MSMLTKDFHVWPDFHGNRSPLADPTMKGMIIGLTIDRSEENLALLYLGTLQALSVRNLINYYERTVSYALLRPPNTDATSMCARIIFVTYAYTSVVCSCVGGRAEGCARRVAFRYLLYRVNLNSELVNGFI